jgi:hypothetical protein
MLFGISGYFIGFFVLERLAFPPGGQLLFCILMLHVTRHVQED